MSKSTWITAWLYTVFRAWEASHVFEISILTDKSSYVLTSQLTTYTEKRWICAHISSSNLLSVENKTLDWDTHFLLLEQKNKCTYQLECYKWHGWEEVGANHFNRLMFCTLLKVRVHFEHVAKHELPLRPFSLDYKRFRSIISKGKSFFGKTEVLIMAIWGILSP